MKIFQRLAIAFSCLVVLWNFTNHSHLDAQQKTDDIVVFDFNADVNKYVTGHSDFTIRIWDASDDELLHTVQGPDLRRSSATTFYGISRAIFSPDGSRIAVSFKGDIPYGSIIIIDVSTGQIIKNINVPSSTNTIDWSSDGTLLAGIYVFNPLTTSSSYLAIWDAETGEEQNQSRIGVSSPLAIEWHPSEAKLAYTNSTEVVVWEVDSWQELYTLPADSIGATSVAWSPDGESLASVGAEGIIRVWSEVTGELKTEIATNSVERILFPTVFWGTNNDFVGIVYQSQIEVFDVNTGMLAFSEETSGRITGIAVEEDGSVLVSTVDVSRLDAALPTLEGD